MKKVKKILIERTKKGCPAMWEAGGGYTNTGESTIIAGKDGKAKNPVYVRKRGHLANGNHALIPIEVGDYIIFASHHREDFEIIIYKVLNFEIKNGTYVTTGDTITTMTVDEFTAKYGEIENYAKLSGFYKTYKIDEKIVASARFADVGEIEILELKEEAYERIYAVTERINCFSRGEWDKEPPAYLEQAVHTAMYKATCYHCREPHFIAE